jgi:hypothetical protein
MANGTAGYTPSGLLDEYLDAHHGAVNQTHRLLAREPSANVGANLDAEIENHRSFGASGFPACLLTL